MRKDVMALLYLILAYEMHRAGAKEVFVRIIVCVSMLYAYLAVVDLGFYVVKAVSRWLGLKAAQSGKEGAE